MAPKRKRDNAKNAALEEAVNDHAGIGDSSQAQEGAGADAAGHEDGPPAQQGRTARMEQMAEIAQR